MGTRRAFVSACLGALVILPSAARPQARLGSSVDPVGKYTMAFEVEGHVHEAELEISRKEERLTGAVTVHEETVPLNSATFEGRKLTITAAMPHGFLTATLTFTTNDKLEGVFTLADVATGKVSGQRK